MRQHLGIPANRVFLVIIIHLLLFQPIAKDKADALVTLLGYPDWLPDHLELDNYFSGVSIKSKRLSVLFCFMLRIVGIHQQNLHMVLFLSTV